jgi:Holliday junction resolvasome RuvABC endonuclease subunit
LSGREYDILERGVIKLRSKRDLRAKGEPSPDRADSLAIAWWAAHRTPPKVSLGKVYG